MGQRRKYSKGKRARAICQRGGHEIPYKYLVKEPGTGLLVDRRWSDGAWNAVDHPRNFPPTDIADGRPLKYATGETDREKLTTVGTLFEVSLPGGGGIIIEETYPSVTVVPLLDSDGLILLDETSTTITDVFSRSFFLSYQRIE